MIANHRAAAGADVESFCPAVRAAVVVHVEHHAAVHVLLVKTLAPRLRAVNHERPYELELAVRHRINRNAVSGNYVFSQQSGKISKMLSNVQNI